MSVDRVPSSARISLARLEPGPMALYHKVEHDLRRRIADREFSTDAGFPSEQKISDDYHVSRATARRALDTLRAQGLLIRRRGATAVVNQPDRSVRAVHTSASLEEFFANSGEMRLRVVSTDESPPPSWAAAFLGSAHDQNFCRLKVISLLEDEPVAFLHIFLPPLISALVKPHLFNEDLTGRLPIINMIELRSGQRVVRMQQEIVPSAAGREVANTLALAEGTPLLLARRSYFSRSGRIVELAEVHYHPDRYKYLTEYTKCGT